MQIHNLTQGSQVWHEFRANYFGASEAAAMLGLSNNLTRNELLLYKKTGKSKEYSDWVQKNILDYGHEVEAKARNNLEYHLNKELYPVTCSLGKLSASCDGVTEDYEIIFEHKQINKYLVNFINENGILPASHMPQCQQILMITGAKKLIFVCSDGTVENMIMLDVLPDQEWFEKIRLGWEQFEKDLEAYEHKEFADKPRAAAIMQLPALSIQIKGEVTVSNLSQFKAAAETFIANINTELNTDEDFVNAEETVKFCDKAEKKLESAKASAIEQSASIYELMIAIDFIKESIRTKRLSLEKLVKTQKESIKKKIIDSAFRVCLKHRMDINEEFSNIDITMMSAFLSLQNFETVCKNKRTLASLHSAVDTEVASIKIKLNELADVIRRNIRHLPNDLSLFRDLQSIINKPEDDFKLLVESRLAEQNRKAKESTQRIIAEARAKESTQRIIAEARAKEEAQHVIAETPIVQSVEIINEKPFLVLMQEYADLTDEEKDGAANNGIGKEYARYVRIIHNGETQLLKNDAVDPEDATFSRAFYWIFAAISEAYWLGVKDGNQSNFKKVNENG